MNLQPSLSMRLFRSGPRPHSLFQSNSSLETLSTSLAALTCSPSNSHAFPTGGSFVPRRHASHASQGFANGAAQGAGKRLGAKKTATEYVVPGNIIFRQRGTLWHPGENCARGRDHTIYATAPGYVRYYQDPARHPKRKFIGVALKKEGLGSVLPTPLNAATRRRLGMYASPIEMVVKGERGWLETHLSGNSVRGKEALGGEGEGQIGQEEMGKKEVEAEVEETEGIKDKPRGVHHRPNFNYDSRESNWSIGRTAEKKGIRVREYDHGDRWLAWRKRAKRQKRGMLMRVTRAAQKGKSKKKVLKSVVVEE